jgi:hypothetical protein
VSRFQDGSGFLLPNIHVLMKSTLSRAELCDNRML